MRKNYESPQIEVIEIEIEDAVLGDSIVGSVFEDVLQGTPWGGLI